MRSGVKVFIVLLSIAYLSLCVIGCEKEGTAEKAGKEIDNAFKAAKDKAEDLTK